MHCITSRGMHYNMIGSVIRICIYYIMIRFM